MSSSASLLVLADDLTGANDAGVQFAKANVPAFVFVEYGNESFPSDFEVIVINTESRHVSPEEAARRVRDAAARALASGIEFIYKKTDSTLRGNIGVELEALIEATQTKALPFIPAFPELGRTTRDGIHYVHGIPIAETEFARDPLNPILESRVSAVLNRVSRLPCITVGRGSQARSDFEGILIYDCESRTELKQIGKDLAQQDRLRVLSGSAAFIEEFPALLDFRRKAPAPLAVHGPVLLVNGSLNARALEQIAAPGVADFTRLRMPPEILLNEGQQTNLLLKKALENPDRNCLLHTIISRDDLARYEQVAKELALDSRALHFRIAEITGQLVRELMEQANFQTLIVFGGDTLLAISRACGWGGFIPRAEVAPGISVSQPLGEERVVISKAGGFGEMNAIEQILRFVTQSSCAGKLP
jgi:uncharacterized protein YgbK (DUF1537 family)